MLPTIPPDGLYVHFVDPIQTNYHGRPIIYGTIISCDRAVDYEGYSLWSDVF